MNVKTNNKNQILLVDNQKWNKLLFSENSNIYFISDLHFNDFNMLKFNAKKRFLTLIGKSILMENQINEKIVTPITLKLINNLNNNNAKHLISKNLENQILNLMDNFLIQQWNETVSENDIVFFLGDMFATYHNIDYKRQILSQLNGHIIMIEGNHDHDFHYNRNGFDEFLFGRYQSLQLELPIKFNNNGKFKVKLNKNANMVISEKFFLQHQPVNKTKKLGKEYQDFIHLFGHIHNSKLIELNKSRFPTKHLCVCWDNENMQRLISIEEIYNRFNINEF